MNAGDLAIELRKKGLIKEIKSDNTPVSNGDLEVNKIITSKLKELTPEILIVSEETSENKLTKNLKETNQSHIKKIRKSNKTMGNIIIIIITIIIMTITLVIFIIIIIIIIIIIMDIIIIIMSSSSLASSLLSLSVLAS